MTDKYENLNFPWRKAWKLDDPEWVKQRQKGWSQIKRSFAFNLFSKIELRKAKLFYLTGLAYKEEELLDELNPYHPSYYLAETIPLVVPGGLFMEFWLSPDHSHENFQRIKKNRGREQEQYYWESRVEYRQLIAMYDHKETLFFGADKTLYKFLTPNRMRIEDFAKNKKQRKYYKSQASDVYHCFAGDLMPAYLRLAGPYQDNIAPLCLEEWLDAFVPAWVYIGLKQHNLLYNFNILKRLMERVHQVVTSPDNYQLEQVEFANKLLNSLRALTIEGELKEEVENIIG